MKGEKITSPPHAEQHHLALPRYRADIDGLRAIAVLSVVGFHAFPDWVGGGFVGVDVFFVISGFLISSIIFSSLEKGAFSFTEFYMRRIKRIFPALILVMAVCYALGWSQLLADEYKLLGKHIAAGAGFVSNLVFWQEVVAGYNAETKLLVHLWSLGIEEQFYIVWPLLIYFSWRRFNLLFFAIVIAAISFAINLWEVRSNVTAAFYSPASRFWELLIGSVLAYLTLHKISIADRIKPRITVLRDAQSALGIVLIGCAVLMVKEDSDRTGWVALLPTLGAYLVISAGPHVWLNRVVLSHRVMVWFGLISYPLYLWHWPLLSFARIIEADVPAIEFRIAVILIAIIFAWLTYILFERPVRFGNHSKAKVIALCLLMLAVGYAGYSAYRHDGYDSRLPKILNSATALNIPGEWREHKCFLAPEDKPRFIDDCLDRNKKPLIFLWGDAHAAALYPGLKTLKEAGGVGIGQFTAFSCPPLINFTSVENRFCKNINNSVLVLIKKVKPEIVLLHADWWPLDGTAETALNLTVLELKKTGIPKIVLLGPVPRWKDSLKRHIFNYYKSDSLKRPLPLYMRLGLIEEVRLRDQYMRAMAERLGISYISVYETMCNGDGCLTRVGENDYDITTLDHAHLSPQASRYFVNHISENLLNGTASR